MANYSHLFWVRGSQPALAPYLLLAHIDVVPAALSDGWDVPPFSAEEMDGFIYGRGTIDDKSSLMVGRQTDKRPPQPAASCVEAPLICFVCLQGMLQALEYLLLKGYAPRRGFYISLGHDEEVFLFYSAFKRREIS